MRKLNEKDLIIAAGILRFGIRPALAIRHFSYTPEQTFKLYKTLRLIRAGKVNINNISDEDIRELFAGMLERLIKRYQAALLFGKFDREELKALLGEEYLQYRRAFSAFKVHAKKAERKPNLSLFHTLIAPSSSTVKVSLEPLIALFKIYTPKEIRRHLSYVNVRDGKRPGGGIAKKRTKEAIRRLRYAGLSIEDMALSWEAIKEKAVNFHFKRWFGLDAAEMNTFLRAIYGRVGGEANFSEIKLRKAYQKFRYTLFGEVEIPECKTFSEFRAAVFERAWSRIAYFRTGLAKQLHENGVEPLPLKKHSQSGAYRETVPNTEQGMVYLLQKIGRVGYKKAFQTTECTRRKTERGFRRDRLDKFVRSLFMTINEFKSWLRNHDISNVQSLQELRQMVPPKIKIKIRLPLLTDNFLPQIQDLMREGDNGVQIYKKIKAQGYQGSVGSLWRTVRKIRTAEKNANPACGGVKFKEEQD